MKDLPGKEIKHRGTEAELGQEGEFSFNPVVF